MNKEDKKFIKDKIEKEIEDGAKEIASLKELIKPIAPDNAIGRLTRMEAINAKSVNEAALSNAKVKLTKLKHALAHLDDPEFGTCHECGETIPIKRILLMPESTFCVQCAEELG